MKSVSSNASDEDFFLQRYNRNILVEQVGEEGQRKLSQAKVLVCGAGGLGSTVIANLASAGVGTTGQIGVFLTWFSNFFAVKKYLNINSDELY